MPTPRTRPASPMDGIHFVDDFLSRDNTVTTGNIGLYGWEFTTIANASTFAFQTQYPFGVLRSTTAATANGDGAALHMFPDALVLAGSSNGGGFSTRVRLTTQIAGNNFRIGLDDSVTATVPGSGIYIGSVDGVMTLAAYSNDHGDATQALAQPGNRTLTSGTTMVVDTWHTFEVTWTGANGQGGPRNIECFVDGDTAPSASIIANIDDDEEVELKICHFNLSGGALAEVLDIDFYEFWNWR